MKRIWHILSYAVTPLCVAVLLCQPTSLAQKAPPVPAGEGPHETLESGHTPEEANEEHVKNPIQNFLSWGYRSLNTEGEPYHDGDHKMPPPFSMALLNFVVFAVLMYRMAAPALVKATRDRHDAIERALSEGTRLRDEAKARLTEYEGKLARLQGEIDTMVANIRTEADAEKKRIIAEAEARAERMRKDAEQQIQAEIARVRITLEREAVEAAVAIAEKILKEKTTEADQRLLADSFVKGLSEATSKKKSGV